MSHEERKLMQIIDEHILNATTEELAKLQQIDIDTQLDGIWFYDTYTNSDQIKRKHNITTIRLKWVSRDVHWIPLPMIVGHNIIS